MSDDELGDTQRMMLANGWCPDCGAGLLPGPRGGAAQNFYCSERTTCREGFNLTFHSGKLAFAQRIGEVDDERFKLYARDDGQ